MIASQELLRAYIQFIRRASHAGIVSLYLPSLTTPPQRPILIHDGTPPAIPELADEDAAEQFAKRAAASESRETTSPTRLESQRTEGLLIRIPSIELLLSSAVDAQSARERRSDADRGVREITGSAWLGLRLDEVGAAGVEGLTGILDPSGSLDLGTWLLAVGGALAWHDRHVSALVNDPVTRLPGRIALQEMLQQAMLRAGGIGAPVGLLLVNPDDFAVVNERYGREAGDEVIREIAGRVVPRLRPGDSICRYGGAILGVLVADAGPEEIAAMANRLRPAMQERAYLDGAVRLGFSFGVATYAPTDDEDDASAALTLIRRADSALNAAKLAGGGQTVSWQRGAEFEKIGQHDRLSGIFTASLTKDYRNMLLLWDTVGIVASNPDVDNLVGEVLQKLATTFHPNRLALFEQGRDEKIRLLQSLARPSGKTTPSEGAENPTFVLDHYALLREARDTGLPAQSRRAASEEGSGTGDGVVGYAFPLMANDRCLGGLYLEGHETSLSVDASDVVFLKGLSDQLAVAVDRARLVEHERKRQELESQQLRHELHELRHALEQERLVHCSEPMEALFTMLRRVAPTDATVLINGESGTGKELIARTVHQLSSRQQKPLVVVDCTAIAMSLMESELFGHEKGAYTGADQRSSGRLAEADGGTVVLDEIGELPLQVQSKLLRFVQERQYSPVGSSKTLDVDVRVIAVTNRDLAQEVAAGRFREDLYYRLNVVRLVVPPLRERPADIRLLAQHFLKMFSMRYQKPIQGLTPEAEAGLLQYTWPGNVRELQNRMMQAVIVCDGDAIGPSEIGLTPSGVQRVAPSPDGTPKQGSAAGAWAALESELAGRIRVALADPAARLPLGTWTGEDLVVEAFAATNGVFSSAAALLGIPETTFRRRMHKSRMQTQIGLSSRPPEWDAARACIKNIVLSGEGRREDLLKRARAVVLQEIVSQLPEDAKLGSILMGVTEPTFRRWRAELPVPVS